jgi:ATP/maltotriose-dependent transcriptional regulator MalT
MDYHEPEKGTPPELSSLHWRDLKSLAQYHERMAENLHKRAQRLRGLEMMEQECALRVDRMADSYKAVLQHLPKANSIDSAIAAAARDLNLPDFTVASWWKYFLRTQDKNTRAERDRAMLELVKAGWSNGDIAQRFGVSKNTVSRAISGYLHGGLRPCDRMRLRKRRKPSPPQQKSPV